MSLLSNPLRRYYLQTMGIETWVERQINSPELTEPRLLGNGSSGDQLAKLEQEVASCLQCPLHKTRRQTVFARGNSQARLMIIGEAPGYYEDQQGLPFVGRAGSLLDQMLKSIGMEEKEIYIANVLKCRPPNNRDPASEEIIQCSGYLAQQIDLVAPDLILALGRFAGQFLLNQQIPLHQLRKGIHSYRNIPFMVSYHPAYLLRNPIDKKKTYADLLSVKKFLMEKTCEGREA